MAGFREKPVLTELFVNPNTVSMGFSRQEHWNGLPNPPPGNLPDPGIKLVFPLLQAHSLLTEPPAKPQETNAAAKGVGEMMFTCTFLMT